MSTPSQFTLLGWILALVMFAFLALVIVPRAKADAPRARLILEIRDERLRIYEYETAEMLCHVSIIDVKMIGSQASVSCVRKDIATHERSTE